MAGNGTPHLFLGGRPTGPDLRALDERYPVLAEGALIPYAEIAETIQEDRHGSRFNTVLTRWRSQLLKERGLATVREHKMEALRVLHEDERPRVAHRKFYSGAKMTRKAKLMIDAVRAEKLENDAARDSLTHLRRVYEAHEAAARSALKELAPVFAAPKQLPRAR